MMLIKFAVVYIDTSSGLLYMLVSVFPLWCLQSFGAFWLANIGLRFLITVGGERRGMDTCCCDDKKWFSLIRRLRWEMVCEERMCEGSPAVSRHISYHAAVAQNRLLRRSERFFSRLLCSVSSKHATWRKWSGRIVCAAEFTKIGYWIASV